MTGVGVVNLASTPGKATCGVNPFARLTKLQHSPTESGKGAGEIVPRVEIATASSLDDNDETNKKTLAYLKNEIEALHEFARSKNNVHHEIKTRIRRVLAICSGLELKVRPQRRPQMSSNNADVGNYCERWTQTDTIVLQQKKAKLKSASTPTVTTPKPTGTVHGESQFTPSVGSVNSKRRRDKEKSSGQSPESKKHKDVGLIPSQPEPGTSNGSGTSQPGQSSEGWSTVTRKKNGVRADVRPKKSRSVAIVIAKEGSSYADIVRMVRGDPKLKEFGDNVARIRRTFKGEMLIELNKETGSSDSRKYCDVMKNVLGDQANVRAIKNEVSIECRELDEIATKEEICEALCKQFNIDNLDVSAVKSLRSTYGSTKSATINLPVDIANRLVEAGKVKIGWSVCKLRFLTQPRRCFKCFDFGHIARVCKNIDRSDLCRRCGVKGHFAKLCDKTASCMLCSVDTNQPSDHVTGSGRCPFFRKALIAARK